MRPSPLLASAGQSLVQDLTAAGAARAAFLPSLFGPGRRFPWPDALYARRVEPPHQVLRSVQTLEPLARSAGLAINASYGAEDTAALAHHLLAHGLTRAAPGDGLIVVCWKHSKMTVLAEGLGCGRRGAPSGPRGVCQLPAKWHDDDFDSIWAFQFCREGASTGHDGGEASRWVLEEAHVEQEGFRPADDD